MSYSIKDVDAAEALVREIRPETLIQRGDYDWSLSIADKELTSPGFILFQPERGDIGQREISTPLDEIKDICFMLGSQWTPEQIAKMRRH
jgi:hypothetical protein